jgi:hypothetical protein
LQCVTRDNSYSGVAGIPHFFSNAWLAVDRERTD